MSAGLVDLILDQLGAFSEDMHWLNENKAAKPLAGYSATMVIASYPDDIARLTITSAMSGATKLEMEPSSTTGLLRVHISQTDIATLSANALYTYTLKLVNSSIATDIIPFTRGTVSVNPLQ